MLTLMRLDVIYRRNEYFYGRCQAQYEAIEDKMSEMYDVSNRYYHLYAIYNTLHISFVHVLIFSKSSM